MSQEGREEKGSGSGDEKEHKKDRPAEESASLRGEIRESKHNHPKRLEKQIENTVTTSRLKLEYKERTLTYTE